MAKLQWEEWSYKTDILPGANRQIIRNNKLQADISTR
jgi:hypothetical protein